MASEQPQTNECIANTISALLLSVFNSKGGTHYQPSCNGLGVYQLPLEIDWSKGGEEENWGKSDTRQSVLVIKIGKNFL